MYGSLVWKHTSSSLVMVFARATAAHWRKNTLVASALLISAGFRYIRIDDTTPSGSCLRPWSIQGEHVHCTTAVGVTKFSRPRATTWRRTGRRA